MVARRDARVGFHAPARSGATCATRTRMRGARSVGVVPIVVGRARGRVGRFAGRPAAGEPAKREGDGRSPAGAFALDTAFGFDIRQIVSWVRLPYRAAPHDHRVRGRRRARRTTTRSWTATDVARVDWSELRTHARDRAVRLRRARRVQRAADGRRAGRASSCTSGRARGARDRGVHRDGRKARSRQLMRWIDPARRPMLVQLPASGVARLRGELAASLATRERATRASRRRVATAEGTKRDAHAAAARRASHRSGVSVPFVGSIANVTIEFGALIRREEPTSARVDGEVPRRVAAGRRVGEARQPAVARVHREHRDAVVPAVGCVDEPTAADARRSPPSSSRAALPNGTVEMVCVCTSVPAAEFHANIADVARELGDDVRVASRRMQRRDAADRRPARAPTNAGLCGGDRCRYADRDGTRRRDRSRDRTRAADDRRRTKSTECAWAASWRCAFGPLPRCRSIEAAPSAPSLPTWNETVLPPV